MKPLPLIIAVILAGSGAAIAQDQTTEQYVRGLIMSGVDADESLVGDIDVRELGEGEETRLTFDLDPSKSYVIYGVCDSDCPDIDLFADDSDGEQFDSDEQMDSAPMILIMPGEAGDTLTIRAAMNECDAAVCTMAVAVYAQPS